MGGTQRLARIIGMGRAKELILGGARSTPSAPSKSLGQPRHRPRGTGGGDAEICQKLAQMPAFALKMAKHSINFGLRPVTGQRLPPRIGMLRPVLQHRRPEGGDAGLPREEETCVQRKVKFFNRVTEAAMTHEAHRRLSLMSVRKTRGIP